MPPHAPNASILRAAVQHWIAHPSAPIMVTEQQNPNKRVASSPAAKSTANVISKKRITGEAPYPFRISGVSSQNDKNGKGENAERSEPNIG
jgi:hypothetical protein